MDLPTCPSCGQSVLDDDAEDCPFCGESMSGGGGAKAPAAKTGTPQPKKKARPAPKKEEKPESDDPFDVAAPVTRKAVQLLTKPAKGKMHRVVCPMCETTGFTSKKAVGREVRCSNPECLVPVFTAPRPEGEEAEDTRPKPSEEAASESQGLTIIHYVAIAVVAAAVLGGGAFYFTSEPSQKELTFEEQMAAKGHTVNSNPDTGTDPGVTSPDVPPDQPDTKTEVEPTPAGRPVAQFRSEALRLMNYTSLQRERNQRKPFCRRLTAEAFAIAGDLDAVNQQLTQLDKVGASLKYYRILPQVQVGWNHLVNGRQAEASAVATEAQSHVQNLPAFGILAIDSVTELATLLVALDRSDEAVRLLKSRQDAIGLGQFIEARQRCESTQRCMFDISAELRPVTGWRAPLWVTVSVGLTGRGMPQKALAWSRLATSPEAVEDALSGWAEASLLIAGDDSPLTEIEREIASLGAAAKSRIFSRCALTLYGIGHSALAATPLEKAREQLKSLGTPTPMPFPDLKRENSVTIPDSSSLRPRVLAAAELAHAEVLLGQKEVGWKSVLLAMDFARAMAPSLSQARQPFAESQAAVTSELKSILNLLTDDEARIAYQQYRDRSRQLRDAAQVRFELQQQVLTEACFMGLSGPVWDEIKQRQEMAVESGGEPWFETSVAKLVYGDFRVTGQTELANAVEAAVGEKQLANLEAPQIVALRQASAPIAGAQPEAAARILAAFVAKHREEEDKRWQQETILRLVSRLIALNRPADALKLTAAIQDVQTREMAYELAGCEATSRGQLQLVYDHAIKADMIPPDKVALLRGFIGRLPAE